MVFLSGENRGHAGVRRLYGAWFRKFFTQGVNGPVYGFLLDHLQMQDIITVAPVRPLGRCAVLCARYVRSVLSRLPGKHLPVQLGKDGVQAAALGAAQHTKQKARHAG